MKNFLIIPLLFACYMGMAQINSSSIIGKPIRVGNLLVAQNDFPEKLEWPDAKKACSALGKGWRLPTKDELNLLYKNKEKIGGFAKIGYYWSSTESTKVNDKSHYLPYGDYNYAWDQNFTIGYQKDNLKFDKDNVRAVRAF